jgi:Flp pilus assembly protein protease CpaA
MDNLMLMSLILRQRNPAILPETALRARVFLKHKISVPYCLAMVYEYSSGFFKARHNP